jgi:regulator-associated protein of mTOR
MESQNSGVRTRLLASSDRESLLNSSLLFNNPFQKQKQLGNYFSDNIFLVNDWHCEEYFNTSEVGVSNDATWRLKERMKTAGVALVVCLNIGIDPPDVVKPNPCARKECWFDPVGPKQKGLEFIGNALQQQYEKWQSKAKYKQCLDPTSEELRRICINLRKSSKNDRLLFHYNGHGVPRPTKNGELWVFGKHYTHYTPVAVCELRSWLGDPAIYVLDCSGAGMLLPHLIDNMSSKGNGMLKSDDPSFRSTGFEGSTIVLASCKADEILPMNPQYPADIFTACLTTPIVIAIRWFVLQVRGYFL